MTDFNFELDPHEPQAPLCAAPGARPAAKLTTPSGGAEETVDQIISLAIERGRMRGTDRCGSSDLEPLDTFLSLLIANARTGLGNQPSKLQDVYRIAKEAYDESYLHTLEGRVREYGLAIGLAQGRIEDRPAIDHHRRCLAALFEHHSPIFSRYEGLEANARIIAAREEQRGIRMRLDADKIAMTISIAVRRFIPDTKTIFEALEGKTQVELSLIKEAFAQRYGESPIATLEQAFKRPGLGLFLPTQALRDRAFHLLEGQSAEATADALYLAVVNPLKHPFGAAIEIVRSAPSAIRERLPEIFQRNYGSRLTPFAKALQRLTPREQAILLALVDGREDEANALLIERGAHNPRKAYRIFEVLERIGPKGFDKLALAYQRIFPGDSLSAAIDRMAEGPAKDRVKAYRSDDRDAHGAAKLRCAIKRIGSDSIATLFRNTSREERRELLRLYQVHYGRSFWSDLRKEASRKDFYYVSALYRRGELSKEEKIWHCVEGFGTDEQGIVQTLNGLSRADIKELSGKYSKLVARRSRWKRGENLLRRLYFETSGDAWYDMKNLLRGVPESLDSMHHRMKQRHAHERSGSLIYRVDLFTREGGRMDADVEIADQYFKQHISGQRPSPAQEQRFRTLVRYCNRDFLGFRLTKNDWADFFANVGSTVAAVSTLIPAGILTEGWHHQLGRIAVMAGVAVASRGVSRFCVKLGLKGQGYGREEVARDALITGIEVSTFFLSRFLPFGMLRRPIDLGAKVGLKTIVRLGEISDSERTPSHALTIKDLKRSLDDNSPRGPAEHSGDSLTDSLTGAQVLCSACNVDQPFEAALCRLFPPQ